MSKLQTSLALARKYLLSQQNKDGSWVGEVELNPGPTAQVVMLHAVVRKKFPTALAPKAKHYILRTQNEDGGWSPHGGAESEVSLTIECYVGLRLLGEPAGSPALQKALRCIGGLGGPEKANPWTQLYCAMLGILPWNKIYRTPVEIMLAPRWLPVQISDLSYWVKTITIPMALLGVLGPAKPIAMASELADELRVSEADFSHPLSHPWLAPFRSLGTNLRYFVPALKNVSINRAWEVIRGFTEDHGDFGGNTCTAMNVLMALYCEGRKDTEEFRAGYDALMSYGFETKSEWRVQCCQSHVWDTGFALCALEAENDKKRSAAARRWLEDRQILEVYGDWHRNAPVKPGGWCFGNHHDHFPVTDCTAVSLLGLARHDASYAQTESAQRAIDWLLAMQHEEGGWSAYEHFRRGEWLNRMVKFKDIENALVDIPKADVSAKVVEALAYLRTSHPEVEKALPAARRFLLASRNERGLWKGNYGINYLYGTAFSAKALRALDGEAREEWAGPARSFLLESQNADGGWGEAEESYRDPKLAGRGVSGPVQTAWGLLGLAACFGGSAAEKAEQKSALKKAAAYLEKHQRSDGSWAESLFAGTVFPGMVYFRYELYASYFPTMALAAAAKVLES